MKIIAIISLFAILILLSGCTISLVDATKETDQDINIEEKSYDLFKIGEHYGF